MITLAMLTGENGLLSKSLEARIANEKAEIQDRAETEVLASIGNNGKLDWEKLKDNITANIKPKNGIKQKDETDETKGITFIVEKNKRDYNVEINEKGKVTVAYEGEETGGGETTPSMEPSEEVGLKPGDTASSTKKDNYTDTSNKKATIPQGFTVSSTDYEIDTGLVVTAKDGSEFVWVPVKTAITANEEDGNDNKAMAIVDPTDGNNYRGILYTFNETNSSVRNGCTTTESEWREPAYLKGTEYDESGDNSIKNAGRVTEEGIKAEYKAMIEKVEQYGGFYVGRYETSLSGESKAQSKKNQESMSAEETSGNTWYGMYEKEKNYAASNGINSVVGSSMIWGSQYDAMVNWILKGSDASKVTASSTKHAKTTTGSTPGDIMNKIYDLGNNLEECTLEAYVNANRAIRGGWYLSNGKASGRSYCTPDNMGDELGSRLTLYIM